MTPFDMMTIAPAPTTDIPTSVITAVRNYLSIPAVVGNEWFFLEHLARDFSGMGLEARLHPGVLEVRGNRPHSAIVCAHADRHGLISLGGGEYAYAAQYMKQIRYGEQNQGASETVRAIAERFAGERMIAYDPQTGDHLGEGTIESIESCAQRTEPVFRVEGESLGDLPLGIPLAYARTARIEGEYFKGQIDNALSLGIVRELFTAGFQGTVLFSTEEEIGKSWIHITNFLERGGIETDRLLVIDTSPYSKSEAIDEGFVVLRNRDMSETYNTTLTNALKQRCADLSIPYQVKDETLLAAGKTVAQLGSTELGRIVQKSAGRWSGATVQIPTLAYHTSNETTTRRAIAHYYGILHNILIDDPEFLTKGGGA